MIVVNANTAANVTGPLGTQIRILLDTTENGQGRISLATETLKPGQHTDPHWHAHLEEIYYVLVGQGHMEIGAEAQEVEAGDAILIPINRVHCLRNSGDDDLVLLCATSPPWYPKDYHSVKEDEQWPNKPGHSRSPRSSRTK